MDANAQALDRARTNLARALDRVVARGALGRADADAALGRVRMDGDIEVERERRERERGNQWAGLLSPFSPTNQPPS